MALPVGASSAFTQAKRSSGSRVALGKIDCAPAGELLGNVATSHRTEGGLVPHNCTRIRYVRTVVGHRGSVYAMTVF